MLLQGGRPIAYEARSLSSAERNYTTGEQESLALVHALRTWRCYLEGEKSVHVMTDHAEYFSSYQAKPEPQTSKMV